MTKKYLLLIFSILLIFNSCKNKAKNTEQRNKLFEQIKKAKETFDNGLKKGTILYANGRELSTLYDNFITKFPKDTLTPKILYQQGKLYFMYLGNFRLAITYFDMLYEKFPKNKYAPEALFAIATIYGDFLKNNDKAKEYFELVINKYPGSKYAEDSKVLLRNLGKSNEDLLKDILKQKNEKEKPESGKK